MAETAQRTAGVGCPVHIRAARETRTSHGDHAQRGRNGTEADRVRGPVRAGGHVAERAAQLLRGTHKIAADSVASSRQR